MDGIREHLTDIIYDTRTKNDLQLITCHKHTLYQIDVLNLSDIGLIIIRQHQTQSGCAVRNAQNVLLSSNQPNNLP